MTGCFDADVQESVFGNGVGCLVGGICATAEATTLTFSGGLITDFATGGRKLLIDDIATPMNVSEAPIVVLIALALLGVSGMRRRA